MKYIHNQNIINLPLDNHSQITQSSAKERLCKDEILVKQFSAINRGCQGSTCNTKKNKKHKKDIADIFNINESLKNHMLTYFFINTIMK